jgi:hypothetical protein
MKAAEDFASQPSALPGPGSGATCRVGSPLQASRRRAMLGGAALFALLSGGPPQGAQPAATAATAAPLSDGELREWLVGELERRNPRLGESHSERIANAVLRCTQTQQLPELTPQLMLAVMLQESDARPGVTSAKGAIGLMQVMPYVYYNLLELPGSIGHLESNVEAGCLVLADNIRRLGLRGGVSAYFWGRRRSSDTYLHGVEELLRDLEKSAPSRAHPGTSLGPADTHG